MLLAARKNLLMRGSILLVGLVLNCAERPSATLNYGQQSSKRSPFVEVTVASSVDSTMQLPGISVSLFLANGEEELLGKTDAFGRFAIEKSQLGPTEGRIVLFCHEHFFCGAIRVREDRLVDYDEYFITIAPVTVR